MKTCTQEQLQQILFKHKLWLEQKEGGVRANLVGVNLHNADLSNVNLSKAELSRVDLYKAKLFRTNFSDANLSAANLARSDLSGANLSGVNLFMADLSEANLFKAKFYGANLFGANLSKAELSFTMIKGFYIGKHFAYSFNGRLKIGCIDLPLKEWVKRVEEIGKENNYNADDIKRVKNLITFLIDGSL